MKALLLLIALGAALVPARAEAPAGMAADFDWFGKLGFPDVKELKFVRFLHGWAIHSGNRKEESWLAGFLLEDTPEKLKALTLQFLAVERPKIRGSAGEHGSGKARPANCAASATLAKKGRAAIANRPLHSLRANPSSFGKVPP